MDGDLYGEGSSKGFSVERRSEDDDEQMDRMADNSAWDLEYPPKKRGRKRVTEVVHIINPSLNPILAFRNIHSSNGGANVSRVFVDDPGSGMHFDWPIYSNHPIRVRDIIRIILSDAQEIPIDMICGSIPQEYTESGVFIIDMRSIGNIQSIVNDGLGVWGRPQTSSSFYDERNVRVEEGEEWIVKVICDRYKHPGTDPNGNFFKMMYMGDTSNHQRTPIVVIVYQWEGEPHPIAVQDPTRNRISSRSGVSTCTPIDLSEDTGQTWGGHPIFAHVPLDFDAVSRILLGAVHIEPHRICDGVPDSFRQPGTFLVDIVKAGGERSLSVNVGGRWTKPSGASRYFRSESDGHWIRVDKPLNGMNNDDNQWHVQIISKRYDSESDPGLMRKIFVARERGDGVTRAPYSGLAVMTFHWRPEPKEPRQIHIPITNVDGEVLTEVIRVAASSSVNTRRLDRKDTTQDWPSSDTLSLHELRRLTVEREATNYDRLGEILVRIEAMADRYEQIVQQQRDEGVSSGVRIERNREEEEEEEEEVIVEGDEVWEETTERIEENDNDRRDREEGKGGVNTNGQG